MPDIVGPCPRACWCPVGPADGLVYMTHTPTPTGGPLGHLQACPDGVGILNTHLNPPLGHAHTPLKSIPTTPMQSCLLHADYHFAARLRDLLQLIHVMLFRFTESKDDFALDLKTESKTQTISTMRRIFFSFFVNYSEFSSLYTHEA